VPTTETDTTMELARHSRIRPVTATSPSRRPAGPRAGDAARRRPGASGVSNYHQNLPR
jgi:hypothetical protein